MAEDLRQQLADAARERSQADDAQKQAHEFENTLIGEAWRAGIHPTEIAAITGRSAAHIRNLRPKDVPPLRMGGGAAPKKRTRAKRKAPPTE